MCKNKKTPYYVFDEKELFKRIDCIRRIISECGGETCYAIKANPFLIPSLMDRVDKFEVCSRGELEICRNYGVSGDMILFSGVVKIKEDLEAALSYSVRAITLESVRHWELLKECLEEMGDLSDTVRILPRLSSGSQFGMKEEEIMKIVNEQSSMPQILLEGIHYFTGTQKKGSKYKQEIKTGIELINKIQENIQEKELILEYGPGLAVPYFEGEDFDKTFQAIEELGKFIQEVNSEIRIDIELGRYIAASCGEYHTSIVDIKDVEERNYCLVDGGIHHLNYYGSNMALRTPQINHQKEGQEGEVLEYNICGSLCTFSDILARGLRLDNPQIGDKLIFQNAGAYSVTESSFLFLSHALPEIYIKKENGNLVRVRSPYESYKINLMDKRENNYEDI